LKFTILLERGQIPGSFSPTYESGWCLDEVQIEAAFRANAFTGNVIPAFLSPPCDSKDPGGALAAGGIVGTWSSSSP
jgi:hypothetical protein